MIISLNVTYTAGFLVNYQSYIFKVSGTLYSHCLYQIVILLLTSAAVGSDWGQPSGNSYVTMTFIDKKKRGNSQVSNDTGHEHDTRHFAMCDGESTNTTET